MKATMRAAVVCVGVCAALIVALRARQQTTGPVDLILTNGKIITVDPSDSIAQALAIRNGTIAAVGSNEQVRALSGPQTRVLDLNGRTVTPGLIDSHVHFSEAATMYTIDLSGGGVTKMADVLRLVAERVKTAGGEIFEGPLELPGGSWILRCGDPQGATFALQGTRGSALEVGWSTDWAGFSSRGRVLKTTPRGKRRTPE